MKMVFLGFTVAAIVANTSALTQTWPTKPIRAIVPFTAGSASDIVPRTVFEQLSGELGQSIVVENRSGAGGTIGAAAVARSEPDGYTILANSSAHAIVPWLYPNTPYDPARDFAAIIPLGNMPNVLVVAPSKGFGSLQKVLQTTSMKEKLVKLGVDPMVMTPSEFDEFVKAEISSNAVVIKYLR